MINEPTLERLSVAVIKPGINPRTEFDAEALSNLAQSLKDDGGAVQPVVVYLDEDGRYGLIAGERRWRASKEAGLEFIHAIIREKPPAHTARKLALKENMQRQDLTPWEIALAVKEMLAETNDVGVPIYNKTQLADELGVDKNFPTMCEALLRCSQRLQLKVHQKKVPLEIAAAIGSLPEDMHERAEADIVYGPVQLTVAKAREKIADYRRDLRKAQFDQASRDLVPGKPPCAECEFWGGKREDVLGKHKASVCLNPACFDLKQQAFISLNQAHASDGSGVRMLGEDMIDKVFSFDGVTVKGDSGYVAADQTPDGIMLVDPKAKVGTWEQVLEGSGLQPVKIVDKTGRVRTLYDAKLALQAAVAEECKSRSAFKAASRGSSSTVNGSSSRQGSTAATAAVDPHAGAKEKARATGIVAAGVNFFRLVKDSGDAQATDRAVCRLVIERVTEAVDREWMAKVVGAKDVMQYAEQGGITELIALALVARTLRLQGPGSVPGVAGDLAKLIGFDAKKEARDVETLVSQAGKGKAKDKPVVENKICRSCAECGTVVEFEEKYREMVEASTVFRCPKCAAKAVESAEEIDGKPGEKQRGGKRVKDEAAEIKAWEVYLETGSIADAAKACGKHVESVKNWHKRRKWKAKREAALAGK